MEQARSHGVTALLNGNCGNSTISFEGLSAFSAWFRSGQWATMMQSAIALKQAGRTSWRSLLRNALGPSLPFRLRRMADPHIRGFSMEYCALRPEIIRQLDLKERALHDLNAEPANGRTLLTALLEFGDVSETNIAPQAGWSLDTRDPTFDSRVVEFCMTVPLEQFLRQGQLRSLVRRSMSDRLPQSTLTRTKRGRQSADWRFTLDRSRGRMMSAIDALQSSPLASRMIDLARMRRLLQDLPQPDAEVRVSEASYHTALTRGIAAGWFLARFDPDVPTEILDVVLSGSRSASAS
jgi:asparagine synthase (glutamine-hydrolysing)